MNRLLKKKMIPRVKDFGNTMSRGMLLLMLLLVWGVNVVNGEVGDTFVYLSNTYKITSEDALTCTLTKGNVTDTDPFVVPDNAYNSGTAYEVTKIADNACNSYKGTKIIIGNNVETIGEKAFEHFGEHSAVTLILGTSIRTISNKAFEHLGEQVSGCKVFITDTRKPSNQTLQGQSFEHVKNTTFYVKTEELYNIYYKTNGWRQFDADFNNDGNSYSYPFPYDYIVSKGWKTFIGPEDMSEYYIESIFGKGTKVAYLKEARWLSDINTYHLIFAETNKIEANTPYFINPTTDFEYFSDKTFVEGDMNRTTVKVEYKDGYYANMIGVTDSYGLYPNEFYFRNTGNGMYFYVVGENSDKILANAGKCYFKITQSDKWYDQAVLAKVAMSMDFDDSPTGITDTEVKTQAAKGIYDIHGIYRGNNLQNLPKGLYIVNGKKIIK